MLIKYLIILLSFLPLICNSQTANCLTNTNITFEPDKRTYSPGDTILITFEFDYNRIMRNWLHGIAINISDSWDIIQGLTPAPTILGRWEWGNVGSKIGLFYDRIKDDGTPVDGIYSNNWGDNSQCILCLYSTDHFIFQFRMRVNNCEQSSYDLTIVLDTLSDSETGNWPPSACMNDEIIQITKHKDCPTAIK